MTTTTVRISEQSRSSLKRLATGEGKTMQQVLDAAIEAYRRQRFLEEANQAYAKLRSDSEEWAAELEERAAWDATMGDDLDD